MKRLIAYLIVSSMLLSLCACGVDPSVNSTDPSATDAHAHILSEPTVMQELSCTQDQITVRSCACGYQESAVVLKSTGHLLHEGVCTQCQAAACDDLEFSLNADGSSYSVAGVGSCTKTDLIIPDTYKGKPVTAIKFKAFYKHPELTAVTIPASVTDIGYSAFYGCNHLTNITLPANVASIGSYAFFHCARLVRLSIGSGTTKFDSFAFSGCHLLSTIEYDGTVQQWEAIEKVYAWSDGLIQCTIYCSDGIIEIKE